MCAASWTAQLTACGRSCLGFENYPSMAPIIFDPINYKGFLIGMTICYDCNHALFSRMYGIYGIDLIINSTGGNVVYSTAVKTGNANLLPLWIGLAAASAAVKDPGAGGAFGRGINCAA